MGCGNVNEEGKSEAVFHFDQLSSTELTKKLRTRRRGEERERAQVCTCVVVVVFVVCECNGGKCLVVTSREMGYM